MQLYKWEWPGSTRKWRKQQKTGKARIGWKKSPGKYLGVFAHPIRPIDHRTKIQRRVLWVGLKVMLSVKFTQSQINLVDSFLMKSHKTKYAVDSLRRILGNNCNSALLVFCGNSDANENFRWATANIPGVRIETVEGVNVYNLLKYRQLVLTEAALKKLIHLIEEYPRKMDWLPRFATPNNTPAPIPEKVKGWNKVWRESRMGRKLASQCKEQWLEQVKNWKWSSEPKGALKVPRHDPLEAFRLVHISHDATQDAKVRFQYLYDSLYDPTETLTIDNDEMDDTYDSTLSKH
ncbi:mitochondrial ribosomal protein L4 [Babesia ovata]|uniref:Large ribosomal subunit protein uL4m n=1 Tax=Babesia ovata TaxID=189622 RepID=A0A2H6KC02_9APIC|nr:mitochondrial ribosomal protein L4 [Babesia ovata]GBE60521.1 mitochondrial ribosomal protein L4 [Babesia ovata]